MRVSCLVENIEKQISLLSKIIPAHTQVPVLSNILIEAKSDGLYFSATDLEIGVRVKIPAKIEEIGAVTIPGKQFIEVVNSLPKDKVSFSLEKDVFVLQSRENRVVFQTIPKEEYPNLFEEKGEKITSFNGNEFKSIFSNLIFSVSSDETRPVLTGILFSQKQNEVDFVATDGYRLSVKKIKNKIFKEAERKLILSARLINEALLLKTEKDLIDMYVLKEGNQIVFEAEDVLLVGRFIEGEFPNYERIIPASFKTKLIIDKEEFLQSIRLASVFARDSANIVKFKTGEGQIKVFSRASGVGEGEIKMEAEQEGEGNEISFNVKFLLDFLKNADKDKVVMELNSGLEPAIFRLQNDNSYLHVIMPVRVQE